jgi:hypothetical protein
MQNTVYHSAAARIDLCVAFRLRSTCRQPPRDRREVSTDLGQTYDHVNCVTAVPLDASSAADPACWWGLFLYEERELTCGDRWR